MRAIKNYQLERRICARMYFQAAGKERELKRKEKNRAQISNFCGCESEYKGEASGVGAEIFANQEARCKKKRSKFSSS